MDPGDRSLVLKCIDALESLASFDAMMGHGRKTTGAVVDSAEEFFAVAIGYSSPRIADGELSASLRRGAG